MNRDIRLLQHRTSDATRIVIQKPFNSEGNNGDLAIGNTSDGIKLFAKINNRWYTFSADEDNIVLPIYEISNIAIDREYNANSSSSDTARINELADVLATLIKDLEKRGLLKSKIT